MPLPRLESYLAAQEGLKPLVEKAIKLDALSRRCAALLPPEIATQVQVANLRQNQLVLIAPNAAIAAKLKLHAESLGAQLTAYEPDGIVVSVKVQPNFSRKTDGAPHNKLQISPAALAELASLYTKLRDSPVRRALGSLLEHQGYSPTPRPAGAQRPTAATPVPRQPRRT